VVVVDFGGVVCFLGSFLVLPNREERENLALEDSSVITKDRLGLLLVTPF